MTMKRSHFFTLVAATLTSAICAGVPSALQAQQTLLFQVVKDKMTPPSYVYGTMHLNDANFSACEATLGEYVRQCNVFSGELDLSNVEPTPELAMSMMMVGTSLESLYEPKDYARVDAYLTAKLGAMAAGLKQMKPFFIMSTIMQMEEGISASRNDIVDVRLQKIAEAAGIAVKPLETIKEQLGAVNAISLKEQAQMLLESIDQDDDGMMEKIKECYAQSDLTCLNNVYRENKFAAGAEGALVVDRNVTMADRLVAMIDNGKSVFCAVGALHLPGDDGVLELLRQRGYIIEPITYRPCE